MVYWIQAATRIIFSLPVLLQYHLYNFYSVIHSSFFFNLFSCFSPAAIVSIKFNLEFGSIKGHFTSDIHPDWDHQILLFCVYKGKYVYVKHEKGFYGSVKLECVHILYKCFIEWFPLHLSLCKYENLCLKVRVE